MRPAKIAEATRASASGRTTLNTSDRASPDFRRAGQANSTKPRKKIAAASTEKGHSATAPAEKSTAMATAPFRSPANETAAAKAEITNAALRTLSRWPPGIMPMWPNATQLKTPMTTIQPALTPSAARDMAPAPRATMAAPTAIATATTVKPFCPVTRIRTPTRTGDPARTVPMRANPSTVTAADRHT